VDLVKGSVWRGTNLRYRTGITLKVLRSLGSCAIVARSIPRELAG